MIMNMPDIVFFNVYDGHEQINLYTIAKNMLNQIMLIYRSCFNNTLVGLMPVYCCMRCTKIHNILTSTNA